MRLRFSLALLLVAAMVAIVAGPADAARKKKKATVSKELRIAGVKIQPDGKCKVLGKNKKVKTWNMVYDPCHLLSVTAMACIFSDDNGRTAYDAIWDSRKVLGYDCGSSQHKYKGNRWETICASVANTTSIDDLYVSKVKCVKSTKTNSNKKNKKKKVNKKNEDKKKDDKKKDDKKTDDKKKDDKNKDDKKKDENKDGDKPKTGKKKRHGKKSKKPPPPPADEDR